MSRQYRLPNGKVTDDATEYVDAWRALADEVCEALGPGWGSTGCDPHVHVVSPNGNDTALSVELCEAIINRKL